MLVFLLKVYDNGNMERRAKYTKYVIIFALFVFLVVIADLILFWTSMQQTGIGMGFSRFWR